LLISCLSVVIKCESNARLQLLPEAGAERAL
jgi:hypothetical protein